jgi:hypothetical protein
MARIKIEDLPVADNLTPEQEALIQGAGLRSFRPTFEALEARDVYAVGVTNALGAGLVRPAAPGGHPAPLVRELAPPIDTSTDRMSAPLAHQAGPNQLGPRLLQTQLSAQGVPKEVADQVSGKFNEILGKNRLDNKWQLQKITGVESDWAGPRPDGIWVRVNFQYGLFSDSKGQIDLFFKKAGTFGGQRSWKLSSLGELRYECLGDRGELSDRIVQLYNGWSARTTAYDERHVAQGLAQQAESICHKLGFFSGKRLTFDGCEAREGGLRMWVKLPDNSRLELKFDYQGPKGLVDLAHPQGQVDGFKLQSVDRWYWSPGTPGPWQKIYLDGNVASALKGAQYAVWRVDAAQDFGQRLAGQVESICHNLRFFSDKNLTFDGCEAKPDGGLRMWVKLPDSRLELNFDYQGPKGQAEAFKLQDAFKLQSVFRYQWTGGRWQNIDLDTNVASALKGAEYAVWRVDAPQDYGKDFAGQVESICHKLGFFSGKRLTFAGCEAREGGLRVWVNLPDNTRLELNFDYQGQVPDLDIKLLAFKLQSVSRSQWTGGRWQNIDLDTNVASALKGAEYYYYALSRVDAGLR